MIAIIIIIICIYLLFNNTQENLINLPDHKRTIIDDSPRLINEIIVNNKEIKPPQNYLNDQLKFYQGSNLNSQYRLDPVDKYQLYPVESFDDNKPLNEIADFYVEND